jgi:hypothetical protein
VADLTFDAATHTYRYRGKVVPSVTQILEPLQMLQGVPRAVLEAAREFGSHVHIACDLWNKGDLDEGTLDPALVPYLDGWRAFLAETGFVVISSEERVFHQRLQYAGTADAFGTWKGQMWCVDIKSGAVPGTVGAQLAAYKEASDYKTCQRLCVQLTGEGRYKLHPQKDPSDFALFTSALNVWRYLNQKETQHVDEYA